MTLHSWSNCSRASGAPSADSVLILLLVCFDSSASSRPILAFEDVSVDFWCSSLLWLIELERCVHVWEQILTVMSKVWGRWQQLLALSASVKSSCWKFPQNMQGKLHTLPGNRCSLCKGLSTPGQQVTWFCYADRNGRKQQA